MMGGLDWRYIYDAILRATTKREKKVTFLGKSAPPDKILATPMDCGNGTVVRRTASGSEYAAEKGRLRMPCIKYATGVLQLCMRTVTDLNAISSKSRLTFTAVASVTVTTCRVDVADAGRKTTFVHI